MTFAHKDIPNTDFKAPKGLFTYKTSLLSGLLSSSGVNNIMAVELNEKDTGGKEISIDTLCGGPATEATPEDMIKKVFVPTAKPIIDRFDPEWLKAFYQAANKSALAYNGQTSTEPCERPHGPGQVHVNTSLSGVGNSILLVKWS